MAADFKGSLKKKEGRLKVNNHYALNINDVKGNER